MARADEFVGEAVRSTKWCHVYAMPRDLDVAHPFGDHDAQGRVMRRVRGSRMRTRDRFHDEFAAAWQFGDYSGPSRGAFFRDSLMDLYLTWPTTSGFLVVVTDPEQVLVDEPGRSDLYSPLRGLIETFGEASDNLAEPVPGDPSDVTARPALSFDVVLVTDAEHHDTVRRLWTQAGAPLGG